MRTLHPPAVRIVAELRIRLLGEFRLTRGGTIVPIESPRLQALLAYLILHPQAPQARQHLAYLFWPDSSEEQARTNLRQLFHQLRKFFPEAEEVVIATRQSVKWHSAEALIDVAEVEALWNAADEAGRDGERWSALEPLRRATELYRGDLLPSCYDEWIGPARDRLRRRHEAALERLVGLLEARREYREAATSAERLIELDPLREEAYRSCIRLHGLAGEPALAAAAYRLCEETLGREMEMEPSDRTRELAERIVRAGASGRGEDAGSGASETGSQAAPGLPFVGRHTEWENLLGVWATVVAGAPQAALIEGEAGIGKSRLAEELVRTLAREGAATAAARCYAAEGLLPFAPAAQWLRAGTLQDGVVRLAEPWSTEVARLLPELRDPPRRDDVGGEAEPVRRLRLFEGLARGVLGSGQPTILLLDDVQWCDADTLEWLHYLLRFDRNAPLLLLATLRLGELEPGAHVSSWLLQLEAAQQLTRLTLGPLGQEDTRTLGTAVAEYELEKSEASRLFEETEGNPLFIVESIRAGRASYQDAVSGRTTHPPGPAWHTPGKIPARVQAVIRQRLAQLSPAARSLVACAAAIGREVPLAVLLRIEGDEMAVVHAIDELCLRCLLREREGRFYDFSHDRIREVAYLDLSSARRALLHYQVARALQGLYPEDADIAGEIARHLDRAERPEEAIPFYRTAAGRALSLFAHEEAAGYIERALDLTGRLPASRDRTVLELELRTALGVPLVARHHYSDPRVWRTYERASELSARLGRPRNPPILRGLALANLMRSRISDVLHLGRELLATARDSHDPMLQVEAHYVLGVAHFWSGNIPRALRHLRRGLKRYDPTRADEHLRLYAQDPAIVCGVRLALAEWHAGLGESARGRCLENLERAELLAHPFTVAYTRYFGCFVLLECRDYPNARRQIAALLRESEEHGMANWPTTGNIFAGWLRVEAGDPAGLETMRAAIDEYASGGFSLGFPYHQGLLARALQGQDRVEEALQAASAGLAFAARTGEHFWDSELLRLRGNLLRQLGADAPDVVSSYRRALEVALGQGAGALAERARAALARLPTAPEHPQPPTSGHA